jgi:hypothetical protein
MFVRSFSKIFLARIYVLYHMKFLQHAVIQNIQNDARFGADYIFA